MSDIEGRLAQAARSSEVRPSAELIEDDVHRGRAALARSRRSRAVRSSVAGTLAASVLAGGVFVAINASGPTQGSGPAQVTAPKEDKAAAPDANSGIRLVTYTGEQPDGFIVEKVPAGWFIQGSHEYSLTIAPDGDTTHPDGYVGKLVVFLYSKSLQQKLPEDGTPVQVGDQPGVVTHNGGAEWSSGTLHYQNDNGDWVQIQAPKKLGWTDQQLADFGATVTVTGEAKAGVG